MHKSSPLFLLTLFSVTFFTSCATVKNVNTTSADQIKVVYVNKVTDKLQRTKIGTTVFNNKVTTATLPGIQKRVTNAHLAILNKRFPLGATGITSSYEGVTDESYLQDARRRSADVLFIFKPYIQTVPERPSSLYTNGYSQLTQVFLGIPSTTALVSGELVAYDVKTSRKYTTSMKSFISLSMDLTHGKKVKGMGWEDSFSEYPKPLQDKLSDLLVEESKELIEKQLKQLNF